MAAGAVVTGVSVGVVVDWEATGCPSGLTGVSESPLEAGAVFGAAALTCKTTTLTLQNQHNCCTPGWCV